MNEYLANKFKRFLAKRHADAVYALKTFPDPEFFVDPDAAMRRIIDEYSLAADLAVSGRDGLVSRGVKSVRYSDFDPSDHTKGREESKVEIWIPCTGTHELWEFITGESLVTEVQTDDAGHDYYQFSAWGENLQLDEVNRRLDMFLGELQGDAESINDAVTQWMSKLTNSIEAATRERLERQAANEALNAALGIPVRSTPPDRQIPVPVKRKALRPVATQSMSAGTLQQRFLPDDVYEDVVHTIEQMGRAMERTPTASKLTEEELRNLILIVLNANYEGAVRGEVFNGHGKTDLLLSWEGKNAFIGECKVWTGPANFRAAIDQLLSYITWRDTKAAIIPFIKSGSQTDIIRKAREEIARHPSFVRVKSEASETRSDYVLRAIGDEERFVQVALIAVVLMAVPDSKA